jgi:hypothetical protein
MPKQTLSATGTSADGIDRPLSEGQQAFNALIAEIEKRRVKLAEWEAYRPAFQRRYNEEMVPLQAELDALRIRFIKGLDKVYGTSGHSKVDAHTIAEVIRVIARDLHDYLDDPVVDELYRRYSSPKGRQGDSPELAKMEASALQSLRAELMNSYGIDVGDLSGLGSPEEIIHHLRGRLGEHDEEDGDDSAAREREREQARADFHARRKATKEARDEAEEQARAEDAEVHLSIREVYRKLASLLHPDRETDPVERERKAALMQRVNIAYASKSLLDLLEIQLELEHIDQDALSNISEDRLRRWNIILREQLNDLEQELAQVEYDMTSRCGMKSARASAPRTVKGAVTKHIASLRDEIVSYEDDLRMLKSSKRMKEWLKDVQRELPFD